MNSSSHPVAKLRDRLREETASVILDAAEAVIGEDGLHSARMEKIAARAGVSVGTLYNHFEDRAALLQALRDTRADDMRALFQEAMTSVADQPAAAQVRALLDAMVLHARQHGPFFAALMLEHQGPSAPRPPAQSRIELTRRTVELVAQAIARGEFREDPAGIFPEVLAALARLVLARSVEGKTGPDETAALTELFLRGVAR